MNASLFVDSMRSSVKKMCQWFTCCSYGSLTVFHLFFKHISILEMINVTDSISSGFLCAKKVDFTGTIQWMNWHVYGVNIALEFVLLVVTAWNMNSSLTSCACIKCQTVVLFLILLLIWATRKVIITHNWDEHRTYFMIAATVLRRFNKIILIISKYSQ